MSTPVRIGSKGWRRVDRRVYRLLKETPRTYGPTLERGGWEEVWVVGETSRSWICAPSRDTKPDGWGAFKIPKKLPDGQRPQVLFDGAEVELIIWAAQHQHRIEREVGRLPPTALAEVAKLIGYEPAAGPPNEDGEPWLIDHADGLDLLNRKGQRVDDNGRPVAKGST